MQIFATAILAAVVVAGSYDVAIKEGDKTAFDATFKTSYEVEGKGADQKITGMIESNIAMAEGYPNDEDVGVASTYMCMDDPNDKADCYAIKFENEDKGQVIEVQQFLVLAEKIKISSEAAKKLADPFTYYKSSPVGVSKGRKGAMIKKDEAAWKNRQASGTVEVDIELASCKVDKASGRVKLTQILAKEGEENVTTMKETLAKGGVKGVIGGFYMKRDAADETKAILGIHGQKEISSFDFSDRDVDGALAFTMAGAIAAAALAF